MTALGFMQINRSERDSLIRHLGNSEVAERFWCDVVQPSVAACEEWGMRPGSEIAERADRRSGKKLEVHMKKVVDLASKLRGLLDDDTLGRLLSPPVARQSFDEWTEQKRRTAKGVRELRRLLDQLVIDVENLPRVDWGSGKKVVMTKWSDAEGSLPFRMDCYLAWVVTRWVTALPTVTVTPATLLDVVFAALGIDAKYDGARAIRDAKTRSLID